MIKFKSKKDESLFYKCHPQLLMMVTDFALFWHESNRDMVITATLSTKVEDDKLGRVSSSHREGRAVDIRIKDVPKEFINEWYIWANKKYKTVGAFGKDGKQSLIVLHGEGDNYHAHVQLNKNFCI